MGIPVQGSIIRGDRRVNQKPLEELTPFLAAVLACDDAANFGWTQYTPYFNDGDPCIFHVYELRANPVGADLDEDFDICRDGVEYDGRWGERPYLDYGSGRPGAYTGDHETAYNALIALDKEIQSGAFDNVLLEAFGDHAEVTITKDRIVVEQYDHD